MATYKTYPVEVEAEQWLGSNISTLTKFMKTGKTDFSTVQHKSGLIQLLTLEGIKNATIGDWIIKDSSGELHLCHNHVFKHAYRLIRDD